MKFYISICKRVSGFLLAFILSISCSCLVNAELIFDHIFIMSSKDVLKELQDKGFTNGIRRYHKGQGTESYLLPCGNAMIEFIWINEDDHVEHDVLNLFERELASRTGDGCPYGIAYRGEFDRNDDENILAYSPPYSPELLIGALKKNVSNIYVPLIFIMNFIGAECGRSAEKRFSPDDYIGDPDGIVLYELKEIRFGDEMSSRVPFSVDPRKFDDLNCLEGLRNNKLFLYIKGSVNTTLEIGKNVQMVIEK